MLDSSVPNENFATLPLGPARPAAMSSMHSAHNRYNNDLARQNVSYLLEASQLTAFSRQGFTADLHNTTAAHHDDREKKVLWVLYASAAMGLLSCYSHRFSILFKRYPLFIAASCWRSSRRTRLGVRTFWP